MFRSVSHQPASLTFPNTLSETVWKIEIGPVMRSQERAQRGLEALFWPSLVITKQLQRVPQLVSRQSQSAYSRKPASTNVATGRINPQYGEYRGGVNPPMRGCRGACSVQGYPQDA